MMPYDATFVTASSTHNNVNMLTTYCGDQVAMTWWGIDLPGLSGQARDEINA